MTPSFEIHKLHPKNNLSLYLLQIKGNLNKSNSQGNLKREKELTAGICLSEDHIPSPDCTKTDNSECPQTGMKMLLPSKIN